MRFLNTLIFILLLTPLFAQHCNKFCVRTYIGTSLGTQDQNYVRSGIEFTQEYVILQAGLQTNFQEVYFQAKLGFGIVRPDWKLYAYIPYFNYKIGDGYNSPMCFEFFFKKYLSFNWDIYKDISIPSIRVTIPISEKYPNRR